MSQYFVAVRDECHGPFSLEQLAAMAVPLTPETLVWHRGMPNWAAASSVDELADVLRTPADEPPPYVPPREGTTAGHALGQSAVARWIIVYAVAMKPLIWLLQRLANLVELFIDRNQPNFNTTVLVFLVWALATIAVAALVVAGGMRASARPQHRPRLLRVALGVSIGLSLLMALAGVFMLGAASTNQATANAAPSNAFGDAVSYAAVLVWLAGLVAECVAWVKLGRTSVAS